jgi:hypothetical protein
MRFAAIKLFLRHDSLRSYVLRNLALRRFARAG